MTDTRRRDLHPSHSPRRLRQGRVEVALHELSTGELDTRQPPLLLLHALGSSAESWRSALPAWGGPIHGLDFAGHGQSDRLRGGGYSAEHFLADADGALAAIGDRVVVAGAGIGAYVALLLAGARPDLVRAALLLPGPGLEGPGAMPDPDRPGLPPFEEWEAQIEASAAGYEAGTDPMVCISERDFRPDDYAADFASAASRLLFGGCEGGAADAPSWWMTARNASCSRDVPAVREAAFACLADACA